MGFQRFTILTPVPVDLYSLLGVSRDADANELKLAYRRLVIQYHPDRNPGDPEAEARFREATEAYAILSDEEKRRRYDRYGHAGFAQPGDADFNPADLSSMGEALEGLFGDLFSRRFRRKRTAKDIEHQLSVSFIEAALGAEKTIRITRAVPCTTCHGEGAAPGSEKHECRACGGKGETKFKRGFLSSTRSCEVCDGRGYRILQRCPTCDGRARTKREEELNVRIPPGVQHGAVRTVKGGGEIESDHRGDLHLTIHVEPDPHFIRDGSDVRLNLPVSFSVMALGGSVTVPTLEGSVEMKIPAGTPSGKTFRLRGRGIPSLGGAAKGDLLVTIYPEIPRELSARERALFRELESLERDEAYPERAKIRKRMSERARKPR